MVEHHDGDREADLPGEGVRRQPGHRQGDEDLVRGVGDGRERVAGEDRQGDPLGQQRVAELVVGEGLPDEQPLENSSGGRHERPC